MSDMRQVAVALHSRLSMTRDAEPQVMRIATDSSCPSRKCTALVLPSLTVDVPSGFAAYFVRDSKPEALPGVSLLEPSYSLPSALSYLDEGDIIRLNPRYGHLWVMYRKASKANSMLLTEQCNSWCVMCSQPPVATDDRWLVDAWKSAIPLMATDTVELGITGGEPTLLGDAFLDLLATCKQHLPQTGLHVLSNGRLFNYLSLAQQVARVDHPDLVIGISLYSDIAWQHDFIVQSPGAFDQTIRGLLNLARCGVRIELRVVIHSLSVPRLVGLAAFIARNLPFVEHVALMGLEPIGFARANLASLWVDPVDYHVELESAVSELAANSMNVSIYNHQLCVLPPTLWAFARQSISDWKNVYLPICEGCAVRERCGGFFHSAARSHSRAISPIAHDGHLVPS
jgi:His-Xaa-Ser repeat-associated downstream radical SAM protein